MKTLLTLVKMQLKEKLNTNKIPFSAKKALNTLLSFIVYALKFILTTALCVVALIAAGIFPIFDEFGRVPETFMSFLFAIMLVLSVCSCTVRLTKAMYFSKDNAVLLTLPANPMQVYLSKLIVFFIFEIKKNFSFLVPLFAAYFITCGHSFIFYPWLIVCFILISVFTVAVAALLSIPAMWAATIFKQNKILQTIAIVIAVIISMIFLINVLTIIPEDLDLRTGWDILANDVNTALDEYAVNFSWLYELTLMIVGELAPGGDVLITALPLAPTMHRFFVLLLITVSMFFGGLLIVRPFFYTMASKPFEYLKKEVEPKKNLVLNSNISPIYNEFLKTFKDSSKLFSNICIMIAIPSLTYLLNSLFSAMNTDKYGDSMIIAFNILIILLISLNANSYAASIYSRDGRAAYLIKVQPKNPTALLIAKLIPSTAFCLISLIATFAVLCLNSSMSVIESIYLMISILFIYLSHLLYSAGLDIMEPHTEIYAAMGEYENDPNELKSTSAAFMVSFLVAGITMLFLLGNDEFIYYKLLLISLAVFLYRLGLFFSNIRLYYKEK